MNGLDHQNGNDPDRPGVETIARRLTGELICINCGYNLHGLSIREVCPECGVSIRATLLGIVDPRAEELEGLSWPRVSGNGVVLWSAGTLLSCISVWILRIDEILRAKTSMNLSLNAWVSMVGVIALTVSAFGALTLVRPHRSVGRLAAVRAAIGVSAYIPVIIIYWVIYRGFDVVSSMPLIQPGAQHMERSLLRIGMFIGVCVIVVGIRPNALMIAMRSVIIRTMRVDRQSMYALLASFAVAATGDVFNVVGILIGGLIGDLLTQLHLVLVALGSVLITLGMINILIDTLRLRPVLMHQGVGLGDVFETNREKARRAGLM